MASGTLSDPLVVPVFKGGQNFKGLGVVVETAEISHRLIQRVFAGMTERCMPEIMAEGQCLGQVFIQPQLA
jgi:hypothetical protein